MICRLLPRRGVHVAWADFPLGIEDSHALHLFVARRSQRVPTTSIYAFVLRNILVASVQRPVRCRVGQVEVEGLIGRGFVNHLKRVVSHRIREVEIRRLSVDGRIVQHHRERVEQRAVATEDAEEAVEPALSRRRATRPTDIPALFRYWRVIVAAHMPLAAHQSAIACRSQHLSNRHATVVEIALVAGPPIILHHMSDTCLVGI